MITFGVLVFLILSVILFPYLIVGGVLKLVPVFSTRRWLVSLVAIALPFIMRYILGDWIVRIGGGSQGGVSSEIPSAIVSLAFSHVFVWAGFLSLDKFWIGMREESKLVKPNEIPNNAR